MELDISEYLSVETIEIFCEEYLKRRIARQAKSREKEVMDNRIQRRQEMLASQARSIHVPLYRSNPYPVPEVNSTETFPSLVCKLIAL